MKKIIWLHGRIKEVARVFHEIYGLNDLSYETYSDRVVFFCEGFFLSQFPYFINRGVVIND